MKYIKKINFNDEVFTEKEKKVLIKSYKKEKNQSQNKKQI